MIVGAVLCVLIALGCLAFQVRSIYFLLKKFSLYRQMERKRDASKPPFQPKAAVVLCLRGVDPFLSDCINGLLTQNYADYKVYFVVDHREDPVLPVLEKMLARHQSEHKEDPDTNILILKKRYETCTLKCSSILQATGELGDDVKVVAFIDSDTVPHPTWLKELIEPLENPKVGATTGNRWFMPFAHNIGSLLRYLWNHAVVLEMNTYDIAWGGSLAIRSELLSKTNVRERWRHAFGEDTALCQALQDAGLKLMLIPSLIIVNQETCSLSSFIRFSIRQIISTRVCHPAWPKVVVYIISSFLPFAAVGLLAAAAIATDKWHFVGYIVLGIAGYLVAIMSVVTIVELTIRRQVADKVEKTNWTPPLALLKLIFVFPLAYIIGAYTSFAAIFTRKVEWRGIKYVIQGKNRIKLCGYKPYLATDAPDYTLENSSL